MEGGGGRFEGQGRALKGNIKGRHWDKFEIL